MALPLRDRVLVSSNDSCFSTFSKVGPIRPMWYKDWSQEGMKAAMKAVIEGGMSIRQAAEKHNIPKSTLVVLLKLRSNQWESSSWKQLVVHLVI